MKAKEDSSPKNRQTAIILACLPWGMLTWAYTYKQDKRRFFRSLTSVAIWSTVVILVAILPETELVKDWAAERNIDRESTKNIMLISAVAVLAFVVLENWTRAICQTIKRPPEWYKSPRDTSPRQQDD